MTIDTVDPIVGWIVLVVGFIWITGCFGAALWFGMKGRS
jgi:hypothetical protein